MRDLVLGVGFTRYTNYFQYDKKRKTKVLDNYFATYTMPDIFQKVPN